MWVWYNLMGTLDLFPSDFPGLSLGLGLFIIYCISLSAVLAEDAIKAALSDYRIKQSSKEKMKNRE